MADHRIKDLHLLPKFRDKMSFLYVEHARIDRHQNGVALHDANGTTPVPVAALAVLMLGPGTIITQAAIAVLAESNCLAIWCGEENVRFYACGMGGTRSAAGILLQARLASEDESRLQVVRRMYRMRFEEDLSDDLTVEQLRGMEGSRVRTAYARMSKETGIPWSGRSYDRENWSSGDPVNRSLSAANSCLYGLCHAAILSAGYSPALGFIHTGKQLSFVYDIADLYKVALTIPLAFRMAGQPGGAIERRVRIACRDVFRETRLVQRVIPDIRLALGESALDQESRFDVDEALPADLWTPQSESQAEVEG